VTIHNYVPPEIVLKDTCDWIKSTIYGLIAICYLENLSKSIGHYFDPPLPIEEGEQVLVFLSKTLNVHFCAVFRVTNIGETTSLGMYMWRDYNSGTDTSLLSRLCGDFVFPTMEKFIEEWTETEKIQNYFFLKMKSNLELHGRPL